MEDNTQHQKITYGSIISISHLEDEDALIAADGFIKRSVLLKGMSPFHRPASKRFTIEQLNQLGLANCLFIVCPKMINSAKNDILKQVQLDEDEIQDRPQEETKKEDTDSPTKKSVVDPFALNIEESKIREFQQRILTEYRYNVESYDKEITQDVTYDQQIQFLHLASSKWLACHQKEAKFENQNYRLTLDPYTSEATLFKIVPAFKYQKDGDQNIYASEIVRIIRAFPFLNKETFVHCSGEQFDIKKSQFVGAQITQSQNQAGGQFKIKKREVNASLEDSTNWKLNLYSEYIPESTKRLKVNDIVWLHHSECNATLAAKRQISAFDKSSFHTTELTKWISLENMQIGVHYSGISDSSFEQYSGNTYSMWILENADYKQGGYIQYEKYYRLKHFATGLYLSVQRPPPEQAPIPVENKDPYAIKKKKNTEQLTKNLVSNKEPPAKFQLCTIPDKSTLFEFRPLKEQEVEKKFIDSGSFIFLQSVEHKKYIDIISRLDEGHGQKAQAKQSKHLAEYLKPVLKNEKEKSEYAVFKLYQANASESLEVLFLESCQKVLFKLLYYLTGFKFKGDTSDKELLKIFDKKISVANKATSELDLFLNNKVYNSNPSQKFGLISEFRQTLCRQQFFLDIYVKILTECITKNELEMWQDRKELLKEIEEEEKSKKKETDAQVLKKRKKEGLTKKDIIELIIHKVDLIQSIYAFLISVCKENHENQLILFDLLPYFQIHAKYIPMSVTFMTELISNNMSLLLSISENLRIEFDYSQQKEISEDMTKKVKVLINLYEREQQQTHKVHQQIQFTPHEKITQKPLNFINFFFNVLWDKNSQNKDDYLRFLRNICTFNMKGIQVNQENLFKLYKKFNHIEKIMGMVEGDILEEYKEENDEQWDGRLRMRKNELYVPPICDKKKFKFLVEQLQFFSQVSYDRNYIWKKELNSQFPQEFLFKNIWITTDNPKLMEIRPLWCQLSQSLYINHQPLRKVILPSFCRLFKQCDQHQQIDVFTLWSNSKKLSLNQQIDFKDQIVDIDQFRKVYKDFIEQIIKYLDNLKQNMISHIKSQANKSVSGRDILNDQLIYNTAELVMLLLDLDIVEIVFQEKANQYYMQLIEPLIYLIQYERKFMKYLNGSIKSLEDEIDKRKKKKDEKDNPMAGIKLPGALSFTSMMNLVQKKEEVEDVEEDDNDSAQQVQPLDDAQLFQNPIMRGFISINHTLESLTYQEYWKIKIEIEFKLKVCSILDYFLDRRQNFLISNILVFFKNRILNIEEEGEKSENNDSEEQESQEQKMIKLVNDYLLGLIPNIARTGIKIIDEPEKQEEDPFAFMNLKKLANLKNMFNEKKPEQFTNYFEHYKIEGFIESLDLDQYLALKCGDIDVKTEPISNALPFLLNVFFFVHDEYLEERCLNVIMRIFNQRDELCNNLKNIQILFDDEKTSLFQFIDKVMIQLTELIEKSEIWLSEFMKKTSFDIIEIEQIQSILRNLTMGFQFNIRVQEDQILLMKEADQEQNKIDPDKQSIMNFLKVHVPIIDLIKNGFHVLVDVVLDPMFPEKKKEQIIVLFTNAYSFLTAFVKDNKQNQMILYEDIQIFTRYLQFDVGQAKLISEIFRDNHKLLTTKIDYLFISKILQMIDHEGRQENFISLLTAFLKNKRKYIFDNQLLILNTFLPMRILVDEEIKMLYVDGMKGKNVVFYLEDSLYESRQDLYSQLKEVDWKDTYRDEPFRYHAALLNMLIETTLIQADRRQYDPSLNDINYRDNFNISVVKLKKMISAEMLMNLLMQMDDFIEEPLISQNSNIFDVFQIKKKQFENQANSKEKRIGFRILKPQIVEFLRLVHITSEKRPVQNTEIAQLSSQFTSLIEFETRRLQKILEGSNYHLAFIDYLTEALLPLFISYHERVIEKIAHEMEEKMHKFSQALADALDATLYEPLKKRRQMQIIYRFAKYYQNKKFKKILLDTNQQKTDSARKLVLLFQGLWEDENQSRLIDSKQNISELEIQQSNLEMKRKSKKKETKKKQSIFAGVGNIFSKKKKDEEEEATYQRVKSYDEDDLMVIQDQWNEFLYQMIDSKKFREEIEKEKQVLADAIINVEKLLNVDQGKDVEIKPNIDLVIKKFINFLSYAVKQPKNKNTIVTLLKIMCKIIEKEENEKKKIELQNHFDKLGSTRMILLVIAEHSKSINKELLLNILLFANTLLQGGNKKVQTTIYEFFTSFQKSEIIFQSFAYIIQHSITTIELRSKDRQYQQSLTVAESQDSLREEGEDDQQDDTILEEQVLNQVLQFLQNCAEGHYLDLQNYIRYQYNSRTSYDMVNLIANLLKTYYYEECTVKMYDNMIKCLDTLNELVQGPCLENQISVAESKFFDIVMDLFPLRKGALKERSTSRRSTSSKTSKKMSIAQRRKSKMASSDALESWMIARLQNKALILVLSLLEMREIKGKNSIIKRIMRNLPVNVLEKHMSKVYKRFTDIYKDKYLLQSLRHLDQDPRLMDQAEKDKLHKKHFDCILQNGFYMFFLICYYFESEEQLDSPLVNMHKLYLKNVIRKTEGGLFAPNSTLGQLIALGQALLEQSLAMATALNNATLGRLKGQLSEEEIQQQKLKQKLEERKRRLKKAFNFFMSNTAHIEVVRNNNLEIIFFPLLPYCKCMPKEEKLNFQETVDRGSVKSKVQGLVEAAPNFIEIMIHEEFMRRFYAKYPIIGFFANYIQLWKDIAYWLTLLLNIFILGSFSVHGNESERMQSYVFFRDEGWTHEQTKTIFFGFGIAMTVCSMFVVLFFLAKIAPLIIKRAWAQKPIFNEPKPGLIKSLLNLLYKFFFVLFSCLYDFEVLYYLGYGCLAVLATITHPFFFCFHLTVILIRYPSLKNVVRAVSEPRTQLILTLVLLLILTYIYTLVAYLYLQNDYEDDCHSVLYCFLYIFDQNGKVPGGIGGLITQENETYKYEPVRYISDSINNILVVIIMINIVAGIIIDTFGSLREEENSKQSDIKDKCFICGNENVVFERKSDGNSGGFQHHIRVNHYMWNYVYYIAYIDYKDPQDYSGIESYVKAKLEAADLLWMPFNKAMELENGEEDEVEVEKRNIEKTQENINNLVENVRQIIKAIKIKEKKQ